MEVQFESPIFSLRNVYIEKTVMEVVWLLNTTFLFTFFSCIHSKKIVKTFDIQIMVELDALKGMQ